MVVYLRGHEGRGIGLAHKLRAYALQDQGARHRRRQPRLGPARRQPGVRHRGPDPRRPGHHHHAPAHQQPGQVRRPGGLRPRDRGAGAAAVGAQRPRTCATCAPSSSAWATSSKDSRNDHATKGARRGDGLRIGVVVSRFNDLVTGLLLDGTLERLAELGVDEASITVAHVPGAFELPLVAQRLAASGDHDAVICLGAVIRGETDHHIHVGGQARRRLPAGAARHRRAVVLGVLTTDTLEQALDRAGATKCTATRATTRRSRRWRWPTSCASCPRPAGVTAVLRLVLPKGSLEKATLELFEAADLAVSRSSDGRLPGHHRRPPHRRRPHPAAPGDRHATWPRACSTSASPAGTGSRRRAARSSPSASCTTPRPPPARSSIVLAVAGDSPFNSVADLPRRPAGFHRVPRAHPPVPGEARRQPARHPALLRRHRGQGARHRRRGGGDHRDGPGPAGGRAARSSRRSWSATPSSSPTRRPTTTRPSATPWASSTPCCRARWRPGAGCW